nr:putative ribonuclease H-like domain-containing protein [Tanacetum cinerariifolium]
FLAYASFMGFTVYQMDVKRAFRYGTIDEKVYVIQPPRFQDPEFLARVYKVEKAMYGLHHAPRAWYGRANNKVVLAFTSFFLFCMSSVVNASVLPFFLPVPSVAEPVATTSAILSVVASLCINSGYFSSLAVGSCSGSGNSSLPVGMPCAFYS